MGERLVLSLCVGLLPGKGLRSVSCRSSGHWETTSLLLRSVLWLHVPISYSQCPAVSRLSVTCSGTRRS